MDSDIFKNNVDQMLAAIDLCYKNKLFTSCLVLIFSAIDCMSALSRAQDKEYATKGDFINWSTKYIIPNLNNECNALELYSARCGIIHTYTADSKLTKENKARIIYYAWGKEKVEKLRRLIEDHSKDDRYTAIQIEYLINALKKGIEQFLNDIHFTEFELIVLERANKFFININMMHD